MGGGEERGQAVQVQTHRGGQLSDLVEPLGQDGPAVTGAVPTPQVPTFLDQQLQVRRGYPETRPGQGNLSMSTNQVAERFGAVAMTLEMPFKDNADLPDDDMGWNGQRSLRLGEAILQPVYAVLNELREA